MAMSAGICRKRVGFEEIFGSSSPPSCSASKRPRWSGLGSDFGSLSEYHLSDLLQMFPDLDPELVEMVCRNHNNRIEDVINSLRALSFPDLTARNKSQCFDSTIFANGAHVSGQSTCSQMLDQRVEDVKDMGSTVDCRNTVEQFVYEMMSATDVNDARGRAARILEDFELSVTPPSRAAKELEHASLKEHFQSLLNDNQILKRAVAIQHERTLEQEERMKGVEQLKHVLSQYQEKVRSLELTNYSLKLDLQRAQGGFHADIY